MEDKLEDLTTPDDLTPRQCQLAHSGIMAMASKMKPASGKRLEYESAARMFSKVEIWLLMQLRANKQAEVTRFKALVESGFQPRRPRGVADTAPEDLPPPAAATSIAQ